LISLRRRRTEISGFGTSVLRIPGVREDKELEQQDSRSPETRNPESVWRSSVGSRNRDRFRHTGVRDFGSSEDKEPGRFALKLPKSRNATYCWSGAAVSRFQNFDISGLQMPSLVGLWP
jgi:hypothetical protein